MKIYILIISIMFSMLNAWEINTHRAFDQEALKSVPNLHKFATNADIENENYVNEEFEGYERTYFDYVTNGETNGISDKKWRQEFRSNNPSYQKLIEAGIILEDAQWSDAWFAGNGRFNNHFYDAQDYGNDLTVGWKVKNNALDWAKEGTGNLYNYNPSFPSVLGGNAYESQNHQNLSTLIKPVTPA